MAQLTLEIRLDADADAEELDKQARLLRRELREAGVETDTVRSGAAPVGSKAGEAVALGQMAVSTEPEHYAALVGALGQWVSFDPGRTATLGHIASDQFPALAALVITALQRTPDRLALFEYQDGDRRIKIEYDPQQTNPQELLAHIHATASNTVNIHAQGNITIHGDVVGRDKIITNQHDA